MTLDEIADIAQKVFDSNMKVDEAGGLFPPSRYYAFFRRICEEIKPGLSVVLGVCGGGDCYHMCLGNPHGVVVGCDVVYDHPEQLSYIQANCRHFVFWQGGSVESAEKIFHEFGPIDLLFIDTIHTKEHTLKELHTYWPYLSKDAIVCFDDLHRPGMEEAWDVVPTPKMRMDFLHDGSAGIGGGFGVMVKSEGMTLPPRDYEIGN